jgi:hypothetical protein
MVMPGIQQLTRQAGYEHNLPPKEAIIEKKDYRGAQKLHTARGDGAQNLRGNVGQNSAPKASVAGSLFSRGTMEERDGRNPRARHLRYSVGARLCLRGQSQKRWQTTGVPECK